MKSGAGALFLCTSTKRTLLNLRSPHKSHNLNWGLWGGMVEEGESPAQCLRREITEEAGFLPEINKIYPFDIYQSRNKQFTFYTFVCIVDSEFIPTINSESAGYGWFDIGVWPKPLHSGVKHCFTTQKGKQLLEIILSQHS